MELDYQMGTRSESLAYRASKRVMGEEIFCRCPHPEPVYTDELDNKIRKHYSVLICRKCQLVIKP
jgi:hypothetical protein